jgi:hypothetical protein
MRRMQDQLNTTLGRLESQSREAEALRLQLMEARAQPPAAPTPAPVQAGQITEKDRSDYGEDLIDLVQRVVRMEHGDTLRDLLAKVAALEGRIGKTTNEVQAARHTADEIAFERYVTALDRLIPGWTAVNEEPELLDWLKNVDTVSGKKLGDMLDEAHQKRDANRVAHIFKLYKPELGNAQPPAAGTPAPAETGAPVPVVDPMSLAAPATNAAPAAPSQPPVGRIWTQAEVDELYEAKNKRRITPQTFAAREAEYMQALAEGRVVAS